jgi:hypothetical protein
MRFLLLSLFLFTACGDDASPPPGTDAGPRMRDAAPDPMCMRVDRECPMDAPYPGAPCEGTLSCEYTDPLSMADGTFNCMMGRWTGFFECVGCPPPLSERCRGPFTGSSPATVTVGVADGAFRPLMEDESVRAIIGGQGSGMVNFRLRVDSPAAPSCVTLITRTTVDGGMLQETTRDLALRCGESLGVLEIIPGNACDSTITLDVDTEIEIVGVGTTASHLLVQGGDCPG